MLKSSEIKGNSKLLYDFKYNKQLILMTIIPLAVIVVFNIIPLIGIIIAFMDYHPFGEFDASEWVGLKHFETMFKHPDFIKFIRNTIILNVYDILLTPLPMIFAIVMYHCPVSWIKKLLRNVSLLPFFISTIVIVSMFQRFLSTEGMFNQILSIFGFEPENHLLNGPLFYSIYVWSGIYQSLGYGSIMYSTILLDRPKSLHEAAQIDGASLLQRIISLDIPLMAEFYWTQLAIRAACLLSNNVEKLLLMTNTVTQSYSSTLATYSYDVVFNSMIPAYSLSAAVGLFSAVINLIMLLIFSRWTKNKEGLRI